MFDLNNQTTDISSQNNINVGMHISKLLCQQLGGDIEISDTSDGLQAFKFHLSFLNAKAMISTNNTIMDSLGSKYRKIIQLDSSYIKSKRILVISQGGLDILTIQIILQKLKYQQYMTAVHSVSKAIAEMTKVWNNSQQSECYGIVILDCS